MIDYAKIREVLDRLLQIPDGGVLPEGGGVCLELKTATTCWVTYEWANDHAYAFTKHRDRYVDFPGIMTPTRREFINFLIARLPDESR